LDFLGRPLHAHSCGSSLRDFFLLRFPALRLAIANATSSAAFLVWAWSARLLAFTSLNMRTPEYMACSPLPCCGICRSNLEATNCRAPLRIAFRAKSWSSEYRSRRSNFLPSKIAVQNLLNIVIARQCVAVRLSICPQRLMTGPELLH